MNDQTLAGALVVLYVLAIAPYYFSKAGEGVSSDPAKERKTFLVLSSWIVGFVSFLVLLYGLLFDPIPAFVLSLPLIAIVYFVGKKFKK